MDQGQPHPHDRHDLHVGDLVRLTGLPRWVDHMPAESQRVFQLCVGGTFRVQALRSPPGDVELWVHEGADHPDVMADSIWIEPEYLERVTPDDTAG